MPNYLTSCPNCGAQLQPVVLGPESAPWLCTICRIGWFVCELSADGRRAWNPEVRGHRHWGLGLLREAREKELEAAITRGTSALPEHLGLLSLPQLKALAGVVSKRPVFAALVAAAIKAKGGS